jgi:hypothetical protein
MQEALGQRVARATVLGALPVPRATTGEPLRSVRIVPVAVRGVRAVSAVRACTLYAHLSVPVL